METLRLCIKIFCVRIIDVSLGTIRTVVTVKEKRFLASLIGFFEVLVWFTVAQEALNSTDGSLLIGIFYAGGFAFGTYLGTFVSSKFIHGNVSVQVITTQKNSMIESLREKGYAVSVIEIEGHNKFQKKYMLFIEIENTQLLSLQKLIESFDKKAFIVVNETKYVQNGYFSLK